MLEQILKSVEYVVNNAKYVHINEERLKEFSYEIETKKNNHWLNSSPYGLMELPVDQIVNFLLIYECIDFSFWGDPKWTIETQEGKEDGSIALLYILLNYVKKQKSMDFTNITLDEFSNLLKGNVTIPLIKERYHIIQNVSNIVNSKMQGDFYAFIKNITTDNDLFNVIIEYFPNFQDERCYKGEKIYFYKLAQLLTSDILHIRETKEKIKVDYSHLIGCSDYKIPQVMRGLGILEYHKKLETMVDNKKQLEENSDFEVEIRASMLVAINQIKKQLNDQMSAIAINDYIWLQSKNRMISLKPYHLTRTVNY